MGFRIYPTCCTSAYCGRIECHGCENKPTLDAFTKWRDEHHARPADPIWSPSVYIPEVRRDPE